MAKNVNLAKAKDAKNDEFYTQMIDIENELMHYKEHFKGKTVLCNCDDPYESNFFKYFALNFNYLGLKKLITTCYDSSPVAHTQLSLFGDEIPYNKTTKKAYKVEISNVQDLNGDGAFDLEDIEILLKKKKVVKRLNGDGDFRSDECIELLKEADIVVTNPPFSLLRDFIALLIENNKDFLIIGPQNALHYKEIFPFIQENKMWLGFSRPKEFIKPDGTIQKFGNIYWYTNLDHNKRHEIFEGFKRYKNHENLYPRYENYDGIDINKVSDIPIDFDGNMGVPDSFLEKYNKTQFKIVGYGRGDFLETIDYIPKEFLEEYRKQGGRGHVTAGMKSLCFYESDGTAKFPYSRIIIRYTSEWINDNEYLFKREDK